MSRWHRIPGNAIPGTLRVLVLGLPFECRGTIAGPGCNRTVAPGHCHLCHQPGATTLDHLVPLSRGGRTAEWNLRPAHVACNARRSASRAGRAVPTIVRPW
jgi:5-methylcytosine-specific restriction endonuclease McrA